MLHASPTLKRQTLLYKAVAFQISREQTSTAFRPRLTYLLSASRQCCSFQLIYKELLSKYFDFLSCVYDCFATYALFAISSIWSTRRLFFTYLVDPCKNRLKTEKNDLVYLFQVIAVINFTLKGGVDCEGLCKFKSVARTTKKE